MVMQLKMVAGKPAGTVAQFRLGRLVIGAAPECDLRPWDFDVADRHCELSVRERNLAVRDLGSAGGTMVNGLRIAPACWAAIRPGDRIRVGETVFELERGESLDADEGPDPTMMADASLLNRRLGTRRSLASDEGEIAHARRVDGVPVHTVRLPAIDDWSSVGLWRGFLAELAVRLDGDRVILDLGPARSFSAEAAAVLLAFRDRLTRRGAALKLCEVDPRVMEVLHEAGFLAGISVFLDAPSAIWSQW